MTCTRHFEDAQITAILTMIRGGQQQPNAPLY
jgi:hypothetical protein